MNIYQERIIAYADILGWSCATKHVEPESLLKIVKAIEEYANKFSPHVKEAIRESLGIPALLVKEHDGIEFSFFSDCFAVSAPISNGQLVFKILAFASHELLRNQFLLRGGITVGKLYHSHRIIFGPALTEVVEIEEQDAIYSRIFCSRQLIQFLDNTDYKHEVVIQDCCEDWVVNIALGSSLAQDDLMNIIRSWLFENETCEQERVVRKWQYLQKMLPNMYEKLKI